MFAALRFVEENAFILELALSDLGSAFAALREFGDYVVVHRGWASGGLLCMLGRNGALSPTLLGKGPIRFGLSAQAGLSSSWLVAFYTQLWEFQGVNPVPHGCHEDLVELAMLNRCWDAHHLVRVRRSFHDELIASLRLARQGAGPLALGDDHLHLVRD